MMTSATGTGRVLLDDQAARLLVQGAHSRMHKWPAGFGGYRAQLTLNDEGCRGPGRPVWFRNKTQRSNCLSPIPSSKNG